MNATVKSISYSGKGVTVRLLDGSELSADYVLTTFSLGVLQHDDVIFEPELPSWKQEAIHSMGMVQVLTLPTMPPNFHSTNREYTQKSSSSSRTSSGLIPRCDPNVLIVLRHRDVSYFTRSLCMRIVKEENTLSGKASITRTSSPALAWYLRP